MIRFAWGDLQLSILDAGSIWLDGGAMFGVLPRPVWERERPPDARNRIELGINLLLVEDGRQRTLVDTGAGNRWDAPARERFGLDLPSAADLLAPAGLEPRDIDRVVNSHLHFDHAGGNTESDASGRPRASFPRAEYVVQRQELDLARSPNERTRGSYRAADFEPLVEDGRLRLVDGDVDLAPHLRLRLAPGHTPAMQLVLVTNDRGTVAFLADLVPTASHLRFTTIMAYDLEPLRTFDTKKRVLPQAAAEGWWLVFQHDRALPVGRLVEERGRLVAQAVDAGT